MDLKKEELNKEKPAEEEKFMNYGNSDAMSACGF